MRNLILVLLVIFISGNIFSQDSLVIYTKREFKGSRPKIGLVLSGGGAKGMAHVGVLKVLDSLGIKPDFVTGTSMGSIVGGLYAIGYTTDKLEELVRTLDWSKYLSNTNNFRSINMIEKEDYDNYFEFPFVGWVPDLPQGAIKGQELELLFNELTVGVAGDTIFDEFPIPYRAVAVDILKGKPYVFKTGSLATAMRSSMSIPSIMNPIKYRGMLLVDGGLMVNFPVKICKDMGADIIIGVYTGANLMPEDKLNSMLDIMKQSSFISSINNAEESKKYVDLYIEPNLVDRSAANFNDGMVNVERGYDAAMSMIGELTMLKEYLSQYDEKEEKKTNLQKSIFVTNNEVDFEDSKNELEGFINKNFHHFNNQKLKTQSIDSSIHYLYGTRLFKKLTYDFYPSSIDSGVVLKYKVVEAKDKHLLLSMQYKTESKIGINIGFRYRNLLIPGSRFEVKFRASENPGVKVKVFTYLKSNIKKGIDISYYYKTSKIPFYDDKKLIGEYSSHFHRWSSEYHYFANNHSDFSIGLKHERMYYTKIIDLSTFSYSKIVNINSYINLTYQRNTLNQKYFASKGSYLKMNTEFFLLNYTKYYLPQDTIDKYPNNPKYETDSLDFSLKASLHYNNYLPLGKKMVLTNEFDAFVGLGYVYSTWVGGVNPDEDYQLPFWGMSENSRMEGNGWIYRIGLRYNLFGKLYLSGKINGGFFADDVLDIFSNPDDEYGQYSSAFNHENYIIGGGLKLSYKSVIGPVSLTVAKSSESEAYWWHLLIGYSF